MPSYDFVTVNVFTDTRFAGNPLAVIPDAAGLSDAQMQAIAVEFNLSETTFVLPPDDPRHHARVRIFTRQHEMPFAGHPNVGTGYILATGAGTAMEEVVRENDKLFYQVYKIGGRACAERAVARAQALGLKGLFVTIDTPVSGNREADPRNGMPALMGTKWLPKLPYVPEIMRHPRWLARFLADGGSPSMPNVCDADGRALPSPDVASALADANILWEDLAWIRKLWSGPVVVKGVMTAADARRAVEEGADGIVVSNHGGRQLDTDAATLRVLPGIVEAVKGRTTIFLDSGIRRGSDIAKALCLGADAVLVGRAYAYGLAAAGDAGVARALEILTTDLARSMKLLGAATVADLRPELVRLPADFRVD